MRTGFTLEKVEENSSFLLMCPQQWKVKPIIFLISYYMNLLFIKFSINYYVLIVLKVSVVSWSCIMAHFFSGIISTRKWITQVKGDWTLFPHCNLLILQRGMQPERPLLKDRHLEICSTHSCAQYLSDHFGKWKDFWRSLLMDTGNMNKSINNADIKVWKERTDVSWMDQVA